MKKYLYFLSLVLVFSLALIGCSQKEEPKEETPNEQVEEEIVYTDLSIQELQVLALENDGEAAYYLGRIYDYGLMDESQNFQEALKWYQVSADNEFGLGSMGLGYMYLSGCGVDQNYDTAKECFQTAIKQNCMEGYVGIARCILEQEDEENYHTVYVNVRKACDEKLLDGYYYMGYLYEQGIEVEQDYEKAVKYYDLVSSSESTEVNDQYAINSSNTRLGYIYAQGLLGEVDGETAISYFEKASANDFNQAKYYLGIMYEMGQGVDKDYELALSYFEDAAANDYAPALCQIGYIYFNGLGVETDYEQAVYYEKLAAAQGYVPAQINLGYLYENGIGVEQNLETALAYYKMAEESGYEGAQEAVTRIENLLVN
ncbi:MAG: tetratricopeptide repeat protein [Lachnospiraceae bacterium]|nr:tetratricopeptide repeat protein [Lachnospiraceae bacterium]